ncbi:MAG TPA: hypothetical protein PLZ43_06770 [bacterium]|nr:hypothetical protein [bacterium]
MWIVPCFLKFFERGDSKMRFLLNIESILCVFFIIICGCKDNNRNMEIVQKDIIKRFEKNGIPSSEITDVFKWNSKILLKEIVLNNSPNYQIRFFEIKEKENRIIPFKIDGLDEVIDLDEYGGVPCAAGYSKRNLKVLCNENNAWIAKAIPDIKDDFGSFAFKKHKHEIIIINDNFCYWFDGEIWKMFEVSFDNLNQKTLEFQKRRNFLFTEKGAFFSGIRNSLVKKDSAGIYKLIKEDNKIILERFKEGDFTILDQNAADNLYAITREQSSSYFFKYDGKWNKIYEIEDEMVLDVYVDEKDKIYFISNKGISFINANKINEVVKGTFFENGFFPKKILIDKEKVFIYYFFKTIVLYDGANKDNEFKVLQVPF